MMAIKTVNALSHYTDWTIGHVHSGALGWVAMVSIGSALLPDPATCSGAKRDAQHQGWSRCTSGWRPSAWCSTSRQCGSRGVMQGLMWRAVNDGRHADLLSFVESGESHVAVLCHSPAWRDCMYSVGNAGYGVQHRSRRWWDSILMKRLSTHAVLAPAHARDSSGESLRGQTCAHEHGIRNTSSSKSNMTMAHRAGHIWSISVGGMVEIRPAVFSEIATTATGDGFEAVYTAATGRGETSIFAKVATTVTRR